MNDVTTMTNDYPDLTEDKLAAIAVSMDDTIREQLHTELTDAELFGAVV